ncbi:MULTISPECIES: response regulator [Maridesulfovibrio]|uniref:Response regulator receiver protein n=1 Tax=Maridesulfovibrio salexigens (strain ATCC 14822 / DSM 2638 / NCIMB 8403 / VKM B-1763) TaxID=526222 RepID=C6BW33_MARSD|nr:response regulator [Maridesulfovibrio salexigens]ACS80236.1 response regulator receiver protein [Maridesulfovibrio salexigens DSM 2638]
MRVLIVDDDFYCRNMLHEIMKPYAQCDIAVNGEEAVFAFKKGLESGNAYDLVCLDLVMPEMDGQQALREIRSIEKDFKVEEDGAVKVIVTTMLDDRKETHDAFFLGGATSYLVKPIEESKLVKELKNLGFSV